MYASQMRTFCVLFLGDYLVHFVHLRNVKFENGMKQLYNCLKRCCNDVIPGCHRADGGYPLQ